jgi:hypothetical protein
MINWEWTESDNNFLYEVCEKLRDKIPFAFSRWGDGEWINLTHTYTKERNKNIDGNIFYKDLGDKLKEIVSTKQDYYMGHMRMSIADVNGNSLEHMRDEYPQNWVNSDILHGLSAKHELSYIYELLDSIHIVYIGNESLKSLPFIDEFIEIPTKNVWDDYKNTLNRIKQCIDNKHKTFLFSAGMATNVFIDDLWKYNKKNTYMDVGSVFDPYVGKKSRAYHSNLKINLKEYITPITNISQILYRIKNEIPFAFSRWGDGEWLNVNKHVGQNCDGNIYYDDLGDELKDIVSTKQDYDMGVQSLIQWSTEQASKYNQNWGDADVLHRLSMSGKLDSFIDVLNESYVVYIGNESLKSLPFIDEFIEIPYNNVWNVRGDLLKNIKNTLDGKYKIYCFSAGMATNVFIDSLWKTNNTNCYIDVGSVFDPYVGRMTRGYHKKLQL